MSETAGSSSQQAELVSFRVVEDDQPGVGLMLGRGSSEREQPDELTVHVVSPQIDVNSVLHSLGLGNQLEPQTWALTTRRLHQHSGVVLDIVDSHRSKALHLTIVVWCDDVPVERSRPEASDGARMTTIEHDVGEFGHKPIVPRPT